MVAAVTTLAVSAPTAALAFNPIKPVCGVAGFISGVAGKVCKVAQNAGRAIKAGKQLSKGHVVKAVKTFLGAGGGAAAGSAASKASTLIGLAAIGAWVLGGAKFALHETARVLSATTTPQLRSTWFSATYWRMAGIAAVLTLPFLFAAAVQALLRTDLSLLARAALGYLPLAMLGVGIAAPLAMLMLVITDQLSAVVSSAAGNASGRFLEHAGVVVGVLTVFSGSPFLAFLLGLFTAAAALALWLELLVREAAVYVIVLMLPLAFAALVWPARRIWAIRAVELLLALILSKFAIVAVLSLGGAAVSASVGGHSIAGAVAGGALVLMAAFAPWALLRMLPLAELASGAAGPLRRDALDGYRAAHEGAGRVENLVSSLRDQAGQADAVDAGRDSVADQFRDAQPGAMEPTTEGQRPDRAGPDSDHSDFEAGASDLTVDRADERSPDALATDAPSPHPAPESAGVDEPRLPGMDARWQAGNMQWRPLELGGDWPPPEVWPTEPDVADQRGADQHGVDQRGVDQRGADEHGAPADSPDPRPAPQPPLEGPL